MTKLILWDIDGTLISNPLIENHTPLQEFHQAVGSVTGLDILAEPDKIDGSTDYAIIREVFKNSGFSASETDKLFPKALKALEEITTDRDFILKTRQPTPGAIESVRALSELAIQTCGTGNSGRRAISKLEAFGFDLFLDHEVGGFGDQTGSRPEFLKTAILKTEEKYQPVTEIFVIGDTPSDIKAGKAIGAKTVAVAAGVFGQDVLRQENPDLLLMDLGNPEIISFCR